MKRLLALGFALACSCATTRSTEQPTDQSIAMEKTARCRLIDPLMKGPRYNPRAGVVDERLSDGPTRVIWFTPPDHSIIMTEDGYFYICDRTL
jgi:hypothetical protein